MFCDMVGSTALSARLELEDLQEMLDAYHRCVENIMGRFGGFVARKVGDGVLIYFGYPHLDEDDAEQAVRAGLALIAEIGRLKVREPVQVRIGVATGLVVVDEIASTTEVLGEGPNLAARLQGLAEPNALIIADSTRRLVGATFEVEDLGLQELKGFSKPQRVWRVRGQPRVKSRFEALRSSALSLVGREEELDLLMRRWAQAKTGSGRVVMLSAEPGIGKSRLIVALRERLAAERHISLKYFCLPHHENSTLFPVTVQFERAARFARDDSPATKLDKLEGVFKEGGATDEDIALFAEMLLLPTDRYPPLDPNPRRKNAKLFDAFMRQLTNIANRTPVLITFEDLHWMDPTSLEVFELTVERIQHLPVLYIVTFRPDFQPSCAGRPHVTLISLNRLSRQDGTALVRQLIGDNATLPQDLIEDIVERTDGVPLFLEEVTKAALDTGTNPIRSRDIVAGVPGPAVAVPLALHASIMARLERLGSGPKRIAQIGAAIGREFSYELVSQVAQRPEAELQESLGRLVDSGLVFQSGEPPRSDFLFKHSLVQDAAYGALLRAPRQELHGRIAQALEQISSPSTANRPEVIARHLTEANLGERAIPYWKRAGEVALRRSAAGEALTHLSNALRLLTGLPESRERTNEELDIRLLLGTAINTGRGSSDPEAAEHSARALVLARALGDDQQLFKATWGAWYVKATVGQMEQALPLANELFEVAQRIGRQDLILEAHHSRWGTTHQLGLNAATLFDAEQGIALYDAEQHHAHTYNYGGHDTGVCARTHKALTLWLTGFPEQATCMAQSALDLGRSLGHPPSLSHAAWWSATLQQLLGNPEACRELSELTIRIAHEQGSHIFMMCPLLLGWTDFVSGKTSEGLQRMDQVIAAKRQRPHRFYYEYELLVFSQALIQAGKPGRALEVIEEALEFIAISGSRVFEAEANRLKGEALAAIAPRENGEAEALLLKAIAIAERQGALSFQLRAATSLARLWREQGRHEEAHGLLDPVYGRFTEGLGSADLRDATTLLSELSQTCRLHA